jgi:hypothetical protein
MKCLSRRHVVRDLALVALGVGGCRKAEAPSCDDLTALAQQDAQSRQALEYVDRGPDPARACERCTQYRPASAAGCGSCGILKGGVSPVGTCKVFAPRV